MTNQGDFHSPATIERVIRDWRHALDHAEEEGIPRQIVVDKVADLAERVDRIPTHEEWDRFGQFPKMGAVDQLFRSWDEVAEEVAERVDEVTWEEPDGPEEDETTIVAERDNYGKKVRRELTQEEEENNKDEGRLQWTDI